MTWIYKKKPLTLRRIPKDSEGFIYIITDLSNGKIYVGKKVLKNYKKKRLSQKEKLLPENRRKKFKIEVCESDWKEYYGSSEDLRAAIELRGRDCFKREILMFCKTRAEMTYYETKFQFCMGVLEKDSYNKSILGKFFRTKNNSLFIPEDVD